MLDASAVLAVLNGKRGEKKVIPLLPESAISAVNLSEVAAKLLEAEMDETSAQMKMSECKPKSGLVSIIGSDHTIRWAIFRR